MAVQPVVVVFGLRLPGINLGGEFHLHFGSEIFKHPGTGGKGRIPAGPDDDRRPADTIHPDWKAELVEDIDIEI
jgi:hypothetical protein